MLTSPIDVDEQGYVMYRPRVLVVSEFTQLSTGYAVYCKNLLTNLQKTNKYELAELATYCEVNDPRINNVKWKVYPVVPVDPHNLQKYHEDPQNAFGKGVFNDVLIDFKPDYVLTLTDHWYVNFIEHSPFRSSFNWIHMPTVDARSQKKEWLSTYANCDGLLTYTDFSKEVLEKEGNLFSAGEAPYATSELFTPLNKAECKKSFGIAPEAKIVGFVSRNQRRKLFPDTIRYFGQYLRESKREDVLLWLHSSYPDLGGWNFQEYIINENIPNKVLLTYYCKFCHSVEARHFCGASNFCYNCKQWCMTPSNVGGLIQEPDMVRMFNCFDLCVQHATAEGQGCAIVEAAACGVPVAVSNYSAPEDTVIKLDGYKIEPDAYTDEIETGCIRAAGGSNLVKILHDFFNLPEEYRRIKGKKTRDNFVKWYSWDKTARRWMNVIDNTPIKGWKNAELLLPVQFNPMEHLTNYEYARWLILNVLRDTSKLGTQLEVDIVSNLNYGCTFGQGKTQQFSREDAYNNMLNMRNYWNYYLEKNNAVNC